MNHEFAQIIGGSRWLMEPRAFVAMVQRAGSVTAESLQASVVQAYMDREPRLQMAGDVAVIPICGPITYKRTIFSYYFGGATVCDLQTQFRQALSDPAVKTILFRVDSPGGEVTMVPEFGDEIFAARGTKPLIAVADTDMCSAAFWLASQCDQIYVTRSSWVGSIGTFAEHRDISGMLEQAGIKITLIAHPDKKVDGNSYEPLSDSYRADLQAYADEIGLEFEAVVSRGRNVPKATAIEWTQLGLPPRGKRAIALGLADKMGTFDQVLAKLTRGRVASALRASDAIPALNAESDHPVGEAANAKACSACGQSSCPCEAPECPADCPTCDPECPCVQPDEEAKAAAPAEPLQADAERDALAIMLALAE